MRTNRGRRLYVFLTVALAAFVVLICATAVLFDGFAPHRAAASETEATESLPDKNDKKLQEHARRLAIAEAETAKALRAYTEANQQFSEFLAGHFSELIELEQQRQFAAPSEPPEDESPPAPVRTAARMVANPAWEKINAQLNDFIRRRAELLSSLTESHPLVRQVELTIGELQRQASAVPEKIESDSEDSNEPDLAPQTSQPTPHLISHDVETLTKNWQADDEQYRRLTQQLKDAEAVYLAAVAAETQVAREAPRPTRSTAPAIVAEPRRRGGANLAVSIYLCGAMAALVGLLVAKFAQVPEPTFKTISEVRQALETTVLGVISRAPGQSPRETPAREAVWVRRAVQGSELLLVAVVAVLVGSSLLDRHFFLELINDPFNACSNKFWC